MSSLDSTSKPPAGAETGALACTACGANLRSGAHFCRECGASQAPLTATPASAAEHLWVSASEHRDTTETAAAAVTAVRGAASAEIAPDPRVPDRNVPRKPRSRSAIAAALVAVVAVSAAVAALTLIVLPGRRADELDGHLRQIAAGASRSINNLNQAAASSKPEDAGSLVGLRVAAARSVKHLRHAQVELRALHLDSSQNAEHANGFKDSLIAVKSLARALARPTLVASTVAGLSAQAARTTSEPVDLRLPDIRTDRLVAAVQAHDRALLASARVRAEKQRKRRARAARQRRMRAAAAAAAAATTQPAAASPTLSSSSASAERQSIKSMLSRHFANIQKGNYSSAFADLAASAGQSQSRWTSELRSDGLYSYGIAIDPQLSSSTSAVANIISFHTEAEASGCKRWSGSWNVVKSGGSWRISRSNLSQTVVSCAG